MCISLSTDQKQLHMSMRLSLWLYYIYKSHWELCEMHIPKTCFPLRLVHDGSQGQHLVNRFKLHKDSSAVQWMQKSDWHPTLGPHSQGNRGPSHTKSPPVYFCKTSSWKPPPSSLLSLFISSSWAKTDKSALLDLVDWSENGSAY